MIQLKNILKSTRINRMLPVIMVFLIPFAMTNSKLDLYFIFILSSMLAYSSIAILNALKDNDYLLPKESKLIAVVLFLIALLISTLNKYSFYYIILAITLGIIYNELSRKIPLGDAFIAGLTHYFLPILLSGLAVGINLNTLIPLGILFFFVAPLIGPTTNIKDLNKDMEKGYNSFVSKVKNPKMLAKTGLILLFFLMTIIQSITIPQKEIIYSISLIFFIVTISKFITKNKFNIALNLLRTYIVLHILFLIIFITKNPQIIIIALIINIFNLIYSLLRINHLRRATFP